MPTSPAAKPRSLRVVLRPDAWQRACTQVGLATDGQRAEAFGTTRTAVNQIQNGHRAPSNEFIAGVMAYFSRHFVRFEDLFTWRQAA